MKKVWLIFICLIVLPPVQALADDGSYFDYEGKIKVSMDVKTPVAGIGETVEFTIVVENTTTDPAWVSIDWIFDVPSGDLDYDPDIPAGQEVTISGSVEMPQPVRWYREEEKFYVPIKVSIYSAASELNGYHTWLFPVYYENQEAARVQIANLHDGTGKVRLDISDEDAVCAYAIDKYGDAYMPFSHRATVTATNVSGEEMTYLNADGEAEVLKPGESYAFESYFYKIYEKKNDKRNSIMVDYPFIFQIDGEYYAYKEQRIYPTVHWDYGLDLTAQITRYEGEYASAREGYENYSVKITNTGDETIDGFYAVVGEVNLHIFNLANLTGRLDPGESEQFYFVHPSDEPELKIYTGVVFNDSVYYTNVFTCTNMDGDAEEIEYDYWYNEYYPDMELTVTDDIEEKKKPQDLTSTEAYNGPETFLYADETETDETIDESGAEEVETERTSSSKPTETPMTVTVETRSLIPVWVYFALPLAVILAVGAALFLRLHAKSEEKEQP